MCEVLDLFFVCVWDVVCQCLDEEYVIGNNDVDGFYLLQWVQVCFLCWVDVLCECLVVWGGNSSGVNVVNIDNFGYVYFDIMWWYYIIGDVCQCLFLQIWSDINELLMVGLKVFFCLV